MVSKRRSIKRQRRQRKQRGGGIYEETTLNKMLSLMDETEKNELLTNLKTELGNDIGDDISEIYFKLYDGKNNDNKEQLIETAVEKYKNFANLEVLKYTLDGNNFYYSTKNIVDSFPAITLYDTNGKSTFNIIECKDGDNLIKANINNNLILENLDLNINVCVKDIINNTKFKWNNNNSSSGKLSDFFKFIVKNSLLGTSPKLSSASSSNPDEITKIQDNVNKALGNVVIPISDNTKVGITVSLNKVANGGGKSTRRRRQTRMKTRKQYKSRN